MNKSTSPASKPATITRMPYLALGLTTLFAFLLALRKIDNFDIWWHMEVGKYIIQHHHIPLQELFSSTMAGTAWFPHEWLSEVTLYIVHSLGTNSLEIFSAAIIAATSFVIWQRSHSLDQNSSWPIAALIVWGLLAARFRFMVRPHIFFFLFFNILLLCLETSKSDQVKRLPWLSIPLMFIWANMHGSFLLGLFFLTIWAISAAIQGRKLWPILILVVNILVILITPGGLDTIISMKNLFVGATLSKSIVNEEFTAPTLGGYHLFWSLLLYTIFVIGMTIRRHPPRLLEIALFIITILLALKSVRFIAAFALTYPPYAAWRTSILWQDLVSKKLPRIFASRAHLVGLPLLILFMVIGFASAYNNSKTYHWGLGIDKKTVPIGAVNFLKSTSLQDIRLYNSLEFGGYITWQLYPRFRAALDGRAEIFNPLEQKLAAVDSIESYQKIMQKYKFQLAVIKFSSQNGFEEVLKTDPMWRLIYWDDQALIYARRYQVPEHFLTKWQYKYFSPFSLDYSYLKEPVKAGKGQEVLQELQRAIQQNPAEAFKPWVYVGYVEQLMKNPQDAANAYEKAIAANPALGGGHYNLFSTLGRLYAQLGQRQKAIAAFNQHYSRHPPKGETLHRYALILYRLKDYDESEKYFKLYLKEKPNNALALANLGFLFFDTKKYHEAEKMFRQSAQLNKNGPGLYGLALTLQATGDCAKAIPIWSRFISSQSKPSHWTKEAAQYKKKCEGINVSTP